MKISIIIPTKDGGEDFFELFNSIQAGVEYAKEKDNHLDFSINLVINGNPDKPLRYFKKYNQEKLKINCIISPLIGKVNAINYVLEKIDSDIYLMIDDDISFNKELIYKALSELVTNENLVLVSFQTKARPYKGKNIIRRFLYDVINIRALVSIYKDKDPFLFGRFLMIRRGFFTVPGELLLEDMYLSVLLDGKYLIKEDYVYYSGLSSLYKHIKRVIMLETGRKQVEKILPNEFPKVLDKNKRVVDQAKLNKINKYHQICYRSYNLLRFITNGIIARLFKHKRIYW